MHFCLQTFNTPPERPLCINESIARMTMSYKMPCQIIPTDRLKFPDKMSGFVTKTVHRQQPGTRPGNLVVAAFPPLTRADMATFKDMTYRKTDIQTDI